MGLVDYKGFMQDREQWNAHLSKLSVMKPTKDWSVQEQLAYYFNIYNAYTVALILTNYPTKSIKDIDANWTKDIVTIFDWGKKDFTEDGKTLLGYINTYSNVKNSSCLQGL